jgi:hypothetical protein
MGKAIGAPGESARRQAELRLQRRNEIERLERDAARWDSGAGGEESTGEVIAARCRDAVRFTTAECRAARRTLITSCSFRRAYG